MVRLHRSVDQVRGSWAAFEAEGSCTAFQQFTWANLILAHIVAPARATILIVEVADCSTGKTLLLLPLVKIKRFAHTVVEGLDLGVSDYTAPLVSPDLLLGQEEARKIWAGVKRALPDADIIRLRRIPLRISGAENPLIAAPRCRRMDIQAFGVAVAGDPETLIQRLCRKSTFRDFAKFRRRLERHGKIRLMVPESSTEVDRILEALVKQRRHRFREIRRPDLLANDEIVAFYRAAAHQGLEGGPARIFGLMVNEQCVGTAYGLIHGNAFHLLIQTMDADEKWRTCSPGLQVTAEVMKWSLRSGLSYFDFTIGMLPYKLEFGAAPSPLFELHEARSLRGCIILLLSQAAEDAKTWLRHRPRLFSMLRRPWHSFKTACKTLAASRPP